MAGVGFSLKALQSDGSYWRLIQRYGAAGLISSGPWLLSISTLLLLGVVGKHLSFVPGDFQRFQVSVTWLFASSLLWTGPWQLMFTRFTADREFLAEHGEIVPNLIGALALCGMASAALAGACWGLFSAESLAFKVALSGAFVVLCQVWLVVIVLNGVRAHGSVLGCFCAGYAVTFGACMLMAQYGAAGLIAGFAIGQATLLFVALSVLYERLPSVREISFRFAERRALMPELGLIGLLYNLGVWIDKLIFWLNPATSRSVVGPLCASEVYDLPIFLAYLTSVPAMAVFLVRVETDFAEHHAAFYAAVRDGAPLLRLEALRDELTSAARRGIADILRVQGIALLISCASGRALLRAFGISELHLPLFYIDATGVALQVVLLAVTSMFFYLDRRGAVLFLTGLLVVSNGTLTWLTQWLGPEFYGYGFACATGLTSLLGVLKLDRSFTHLVRDTFMLQPVAP
jgi:uncharacterized membrane protein